MKILTLNTWAGRLQEPLFEFIKNKSNEIDVFCFQEIHDGAADTIVEHPEEVSDLFEKLVALLPDFQGYFTEQFENTGMAIFVRRNIEIEKVESHVILTSQELSRVVVSSGRTAYPRMLQSVYLKNPKITVHNFHGVPKDGKVDTPERELQTRRLLENLAADPNQKILVGDFNLRPNTKAITDVEKVMTNLIKDTNFTTTRSKFYDKLEELPFADYIFVSPNLQTKNFTVLPDEVSDHLALEVEIE